MIAAYPNQKFKDVFNGGGYAWVDQRTTRAIRTFFIGEKKIHELIEQVDGDVAMTDVKPSRWEYLVNLQIETFGKIKG